MRNILLALWLFLFWMALSGYFTAFLLGVGVLAVVLCVIVANRMGTADEEGFPIQLAGGALTYIPWLVWEIIKSGWSVTRIIINPQLPISPTMTRVYASQKSPSGVNVYALSITLTPGTVTTNVDDNVLIVHALEESGADDLEAGGMDARVSRFEGAQAMFTVASIAVVLALGLAVTRAIAGPTVFDRLLAANTIGTLAILLLAVIGFLTGRPEWLDIGLVYGYLNLIGTLAVLKYFRHGDLAHDASKGAKR